ncbi:MAG: tRNA (adenosine(37)-N6)-dimethylallyltransferase MiaA [Candidatus Acidiferrales bacterium]
MSDSEFGRASDSEFGPLIVVLGPTASGKSSLGVSLAQNLGGEILACDSTQVYRHFDIGTAKVPASERRGIPHHLTDLVEPDQVFTAGEYRRQALSALEDLRRRGKVPVITAGTGLYLRALLEGLAEAPARSEELRERLRERVAQRGGEHLHRILARLDPETAARIAPRDTQKVIRAIEMRILARQPVGEIHRAGRQPLQGYQITKIGLLPERSALYARTDVRVRAMVAAGWVGEVERLIAMGIPADAKPFQFIGYSELRGHALGQMPLEAAIEKTQQATRNFAKRQITWFRRESGVKWLSGFGDDPAIVAEATALASS